MTPVIFRKFIEGGDLIALFPTVPGDNSPATCSSYQFIGQHGAASVALFYSETVPAHETEYRLMLKHLQGQGYDLRVYVRYQPSFTKQRLDALKR